jgi:hypothetical protein
MSFKEIAQKLLDDGYLVLVSGKPILTAKFEKEIGYETKTPIETILSPKQVSNELVKPTTYTDNPKEVWNAFVDSCEIPWRTRTTSNETYTLRQYSLGIAKTLMRIINDPKIDYKRLVESTKQYYKTTSYKMVLSNYLAKEVWRDAYENYTVKSIKLDSTDGSSLWETE